MHFLPAILALLPFFTATLAVPDLQIEYLGGNNECSRRTKAGDHIDVHYRGTLVDGTPFDASYDRGSPLSFQLGAGRVIKGWDDGLLEMCIGEKRKLTIPPELAYGDRGVGPIPAGSTLIFETEMMAIKGVDKDEL